LKERGATIQHKVKEELTCPGVIFVRILPGLRKGAVVTKMAVQRVDVANISKPKNFINLEENTMI